MWQSGNLYTVLHLDGVPSRGTYFRGSTARNVKIRCSCGESQTALSKFLVWHNGVLNETFLIQSEPLFCYELRFTELLMCEHWLQDLNQS